MSVPEHEELAFQIVENLARADIKAEAVPWHGAVIVQVSPTLSITTGYSGWEYGSLSVLRDNMWDDAGGDAIDFPGVDEDCEDPVLIASGIAKAVARREW